MTETVPTLESAYRSHRGLLFSALAKLAAQGYVAQPADAADLMHDFFVEAWEGIAQRYDSQKASLPTYLYAAFVRFARPRIVRIQRQREALVDPAEIEDLVDVSSTASGPEHNLDLQRVRKSVNSLSTSERELLCRWLNSPRSSEREVARELGVSRYELRQRLITALGQVSTALNALHGIEGFDRDIAIAIWRDGLTVREAATRLGLHPQQARNALAHNQQHILQSLPLVHQVPLPHSRRSSMPKILIENMVKKILEAPLGEADVAEIEQHAADLAEYFTQAGDEASKPLQELSDWRLAVLYSAIARGLGVAEYLEQEVTEDDALFHANINDRCAVGRAFAEALVPALSPYGIDHLLEQCRKNAVSIPTDECKILRLEPDVVSGGDKAYSLTQFGLSPMHLVLATDAVAMLLERAIDANYFSRGHRLIFRRSHYEVQAVSSDEQHRSLSRSDLIVEICTMASTEESTGQVLLDWLVDVAPRVNSLFGGFNAEDSGGGLVVLTQLVLETDLDDLYVRWSQRSMAPSLETSLTRMA